MKTNCIESLLQKFFHSYSRILCRFPICIATFSVIVTLILSSGFIFFSYESSVEQLYTPQESRARVDQQKVLNIFSTDFDQFIPNRVHESDQRQVSTVLYPINSGNILRLDQLKNIMDFSLEVFSMQIQYNQSNYTFAAICARWKRRCVTNPLLEYFNTTLDFYASGSNGKDDFSLPYPYITDNHGTVYNIEPYLAGAVEINGTTSHADYLFVTFYLRGGDTDELSRLWEDQFVQRFTAYESSSIEVFIFPSNGLDKIQTDLTKSIIPYFSVTYTLLITFAITSSIMFRDTVQSKPWLASMGVLSASMAVVSTIGLLSYFGVPFNQVATSVPFLVLGIGLDDAFILISAWRATNQLRSVQERTEETLKDAGVSITITSLTDFLAFAVGSISPLPAIKTFCYFAGVAVFLDFFFQLTFFGSFLVIFGRRERTNRHYMTCLKVRPRNDPKNDIVYNICCSGGKSSNSTEQQIEHLGIIFFKRYFSRLFSSVTVIGCILIFYLCYIGISLYGFINIREGLQLKNLATQGSQEYKFLDLRSAQFDNIGPPFAVVITQEMPYWEQSIAQYLGGAITRFELSEFVKSQYTQCWFITYYNFLIKNNSSLKGKEPFLNHLRETFLRIPQYSHFDSDIKFSNNTIVSSRCIFVTENVNNAKKQGDMMLALREIADSLTNDSQEFIVFAPEFIFYEQYVIIMPQTLQTVGIAVAVMFFVSLLLIPNPLVCILVSLSVASILLGVIGLMTLWDVYLESISLINLVLCIGFSVDFTAHVAYTFVTSDSNFTPIDRLSLTIGVLGYPLLQSAISTVLGVMILLLFPSYVFQTFAKIIILVMIIGFMHGLLVVPVVMILILRAISEKGPAGQMHQSEEELSSKTASFDAKTYYTNLATTLDEVRGRNDAGRVIPYAKLRYELQLLS